MILAYAVVDTAAQSLTVTSFWPPEPCRTDLHERTDVHFVPPNRNRQADAYAPVTASWSRERLSDAREQMTDHAARDVLARLGFTTAGPWAPLVNDATCTRWTTELAVLAYVPDYDPDPEFEPIPEEY